MVNKILNFVTGCMGFITWVYLSKESPNQAINIAMGVLLMLIGFGGRDTIIDIIKSIKNIKD